MYVVHCDPDCLQAISNGAPARRETQIRVTRANADQVHISCPCQLPRLAVANRYAGAVLRFLARADMFNDLRARTTFVDRLLAANPSGPALIFMVRRRRTEVRFDAYESDVRFVAGSFTDEGRPLEDHLIEGNCATPTRLAFPAEAEFIFVCYQPVDPYRQP